MSYYRVRVSLCMLKVLVCPFSCFVEVFFVHEGCALYMGWVSAQPHVQGTPLMHKKDLNIFLVLCRLGFGSKPRACQIPQRPVIRYVSRCFSCLQLDVCTS